MSGPYGAALAAFLPSGAAGAPGRSWQALPFFTDGKAAGVVAELDRRVVSGAQVLPPPAHLFHALGRTPLDAVKVVILGQDPYPTPGDAHGLAFSVQPGQRIPRSLANIFKEREADLGLALPANGDLTAWADQGVLLFNACLSVEAGAAGAHRRLGWQALTEQVIRAVSDRLEPSAFVLWGADAQAHRALVDGGRHLVLASAHPSPLSARRGFFGSRPFSRVNAWLEAQGRGGVEW